MANRDDILAVVGMMRYLPNNPAARDDSAAGPLEDRFFMVLSDLPVEVLRAAAVQHLAEATFFPTPGQLRERAMDLQLLALGIPQPAEAWAQVLKAPRYVPMALCELGAELRRSAEKQGLGYFKAVAEYSKHLAECTVCTEGGYRETYPSPAVAECVRLLGGRDALMTDNPAADRARFIEAYREIVGRERMKAGMLPQVKEFLARAASAELPPTVAAIKQLAGRLKA